MSVSEAGAGPGARWPERLEHLYYRGLRRFRGVAAPLIFGQHPAVVEYLVRKYASREEHVLDVGARRSPYTGSIRGTVVGLDLPAEEDARLGFSPQSLGQFARAGHVAVYGRAEDIPFPDESFGAVLMIEVIEHVEGDAQAIREAARVLRPGGRLILTTPNGATFPEPARYHLRHYTPEALQQLVAPELEIEHLWQLFPDGRLWTESIRSVRNMLKRGAVPRIALHCLAVWVYWVPVLACAAARRVRGTTTLCLVAKKAGP